jgi:hypothetical protein
MKNWKTTLLGIAAGFMNLIAGGMTPKNAGLSLALAALGCAAKDLNVTGGTVDQGDK